MDNEVVDTKTLAVAGLRKLLDEIEKDASVVLAFDIERGTKQEWNGKRLEYVPSNERTMLLYYLVKDKVND